MKAFISASNVTQARCAGELAVAIKHMAGITPRVTLSPESSKLKAVNIHITSHATQRDKYVIDQILKRASKHDTEVSMSVAFGNNPVAFLRMENTAVV